MPDTVSGPYCFYCDFDRDDQFYGNNFCGFIQVTNDGKYDDFDWYRAKTATNTPQTGPQSGNHGKTCVSCFTTKFPLDNNHLATFFSLCRFIGLRLHRDVHGAFSLESNSWHRPQFLPFHLLLYKLRLPHVRSWRGSARGSCHPKWSQERGKRLESF